MFLIVCSCYFLFIRAPSCVISSSRVFFFFVFQRVSSCIVMYRRVSSCIVVFPRGYSCLFLSIFVFVHCQLCLVPCVACRVSCVLFIAPCVFFLVSCFFSKAEQ